MILQILISELSTTFDKNLQLISFFFKFCVIFELIFAVKICVRDVIPALRSIAWVTSLKKMISELTYETLIFMNIY